MSGRPIPQPSLKRIPVMLQSTRKGRLAVLATVGLLLFATAAATASLTGPGTAMAASINAPPTTVIGAGGTQTFNTGGQLAVGANQTAGTYSGTYTVSVAYQ